jgi:hypothetical protein
MNRQVIALAVITAVAAPVGYSAPDLLEIHEQVSDKLRTAGSFLLPGPLFDLIDSVPRGTTPHERILQLAQAGQPPAAPGVDPLAIADWANDFALATTQRTLDGLFPRGTPREPVVVGGDAKSHATMEEDLNVMMRIFEKAAGGKNEARPTAGGIELFAFGRSSGPRVFYLDGYGAMFVLNVKYPLLAPPAKDDQSRTNEPADTEWEKAKEEVYGRRAPREDLGKFNAAVGEEFDSQRVEDLKTQIIDDLVNAKNIRGMKADDYVTVVVLGGGTRGGSIRREVRSPRAGGAGGGGGGGRGGGTIYGGVTMMESTSEIGAQSTMTLRAKKSDIDTLAKGELNADEFRKKVSVQVY